MPRVFIPAVLREATQGVEYVDLEVATLRNVLEALTARFPELAHRLQHGDELSTAVSASIDGAILTRNLRTHVSDAREIHFIAAISGG